MNVSQPGNAEADERRISEFVTNRCTKLSKRGKKKEKKERQQEEQVKIKKKARSLSMHPLFTFNAPCTSRKWRADSAAAVRECTEDFGALSFYLFIFYLFFFCRFRTRVQFRLLCRVTVRASLGPEQLRR